MTILFVTATVLLVTILIIPSKLRFFIGLFLSLFISVISSIPAIYVLAGYVLSPFSLSIFSSVIIIDKLTSFFIIVTNFTMLTGMLYSKGYLETYSLKKSGFSFSFHYFNYLLLHLSMLLVLVFRNGLAFLIAWEIMAVSSFFLVLFESEKRSVIKIAVNYLIQMHIGFMFILIGLLICNSATGSMSFDALSIYFANHNNFGLFLIFFIGFGIKAGFIPLHTWLPDAHPAAPSHVSATMSGVMIKMGIYGIIRVLTYVQFDLYYIGLFILILSAFSGLMGVMSAIVQHDLKKLLAYHSIENIGIIGMGIGLGTIGISINNPVIAVLGFSGGLLHVLNHSLFKSLLFFSAGAVYKKYKTRNIEQLGGVIHKMPKTAGFFLIGAVAICGLPPLNGFISEILIYSGLFKGLINATFYNSIVMIAGIISLVLIGGLAIFCFTKVFSVVFLGTARTEPAEDIKEVGSNMLFPQLLVAIVIIAIGLLPMIFVKPVCVAVHEIFNISTVYNINNITVTLWNISLIGFILIVVICLLMFIRARVQKNKNITTGEAWGCGYTNITAKHQYTGTSFSKNFHELARAFIKIRKEYKPIEEHEIFPSKRTFISHHEDIFKKLSLDIIRVIMMILKKLARLQTGQIQHYILYAFVYIIIIFILLYLGWI